MKKLLLASLIAGSTMLGIVGCGDDKPTNTVEGTQYLQYSKGDTMTYEVYDRDTTNARVDASKSVRMWVVLDTGLTYQNRTNVSQILEINYQANGTTETGRDTVYIRSTTDGVVEQYDVLGSMIGRIALAASYADLVPKQWVQIGQVKLTQPTTWTSATGGQFTLPIQTGVGTFNAVTSVNMNASHKGTQTVTLGDSSYPNSRHTDHALLVTSNVNQPPVTGEVLRDSLIVGYDVDIKAGIVRQVLNGKAVSVGTTLVPLGRQPVTGFEMNLKSYSKKK